MLTVQNKPIANGIKALVCGSLKQIMEKVPGSGLRAGVEGVWTGIYPMEERVEIFTDIFNRPDYVILFCSGK